MTELEQKAKELSRHFLEHEKEYRIGFVEAEQSNPKTKTMGEQFREDTKAGIQTLLDVDRDLVALFSKTIYSREFDAFFEDVFSTIQNGGRIILSGCGSTGRLAMRIEASWRIAIRELTKTKPEIQNYENSVLSLMTGGDYAIIRSVESFEDYTQLGEMQARELSVTEKDMLIGVTATGETTSILGTAKQALTDGANVWMIVCTKPESILGKLKRADDVYTHKNCRSLYMSCGGMSVTGSTRMQSSTIEQSVISAALELSLSRICKKECTKEYLTKGFERCVGTLGQEAVIESMKEQIERETELYRENGHVTYFSDEYLLDVLADTTERAPTFSVPHFRPQKKKDEPLSWAFVKNPLLETKDAWRGCFERVPRCVDKTIKEYVEIGIKGEDIRRIPKIDLEALYEFEIGKEKDPERETGNSLATWVGFDDVMPAEFKTHAGRYKVSSKLILNPSSGSIYPTFMKMFHHIAMKLMINIVSTGTMAKMGRIQGNYMVYISISNKKLVDRATRIIADLCGIDYEQANYELFYSKLLLEERQVEGMVAVETIQRLQEKRK